MATDSVTLWTCVKSAPVVLMSKAAWFSSSEVFSVVGPRELDDCSKGWSPKDTVYEFPPVCVTPSGTPGPPGMQAVFPVQSACVIVTLWSSIWAKHPRSGSRSRAMILRLRIYLPRSVDEDVEAEAGTGGEGGDLRVPDREHVVRVAVMGGRDGGDVRARKRAERVRASAAKMEAEPPLRPELEAELRRRERVGRLREQGPLGGIADGDEFRHVPAQVPAGIEVQRRGDRPIGGSQGDAAAIPEPDGVVGEAAVQPEPPERPDQQGQAAAARSAAVDPETDDGPFRLLVQRPFLRAQGDRRRRGHGSGGGVHDPEGVRDVRRS